MMETSDTVADARKIIAPQQPVLDVGKALREAREGMGLSVHDIANRIKFAPRQVEALEANDFNNLPQTTFLRGFVRSYARVLQLDEVALIAALPCEPAKQVVAKALVVDVAFPTLLSLQRVNLLWLTGALGVALVLGLFVLLPKGEPTTNPAEVVVEPVVLPTSDVTASAVEDAEVQPKVAEVVEVATPPKVPEPVVSQKRPEPVKAKEPVVKPELQPNAVSAPVSVDKPAVPLEALMRRPLHFVFGEAMWVEVTDARGAILLSRNVPRGSEKWIGGPGRAPYSISVSNPRKVNLYYKGNPIDLSAYPATGMAHLTLK
jgi:cytoskeleton protein RodZ